MKKLRFKKVFIYIIADILLLIYGGWTYSRLPGNYIAFEGEDYIKNAQAQTGRFFKLSGKGLGNCDTFGPVSAGSVRAEARLLGLIPFKEVNIDILPSQSVVPCGCAVGVKLFTEGLLVLDVAKIGSSSPAGNAGIKAGDILLTADQERLVSYEQLTTIIAGKHGSPIRFKVSRAGREFEVNITPQKKNDDGIYRIGAWVRDSTAGIGTLTFYRPENNTFAALGHGIIDSDVGSVYKIASGSIQCASIASVSKGERGAPGELKGIFIEDTAGFGTITSNTELGIYGKINLPQFLPNESPVPVASRSQVTEGPATILCTVDGSKIDSFGARIQKVMPSSSNSSKGMIIQITDKRLIDKTGGIVQGMSGSPIIQNGKLIGAVTHVFVNDPTRGYGIFIDNMLRMLNQAA